MVMTETSQICSIRELRVSSRPILNRLLITERLAQVSMGEQEPVIRDRLGD